MEKQREEKFAGSSFTKVPETDKLPLPTIPAGYTLNTNKKKENTSGKKIRKRE
ncbi:hypothetical protein NEOKW01_1886 [Nematocida sp. AWRm80]|nr:hypothetical protein NEOKW01_1886 [Nematocida sp. AWRm80]